MLKVFVAALAILGMAGLASDAFAQQKRCPKGKVYSAKAGKCVTPQRPAPRSSTPRGSW
jgi:hypothetical protein